MRQIARCREEAETTMYRAEGRYIRAAGACRVTEDVKKVERGEIVGGEDEGTGQEGRARQTERDDSESDRSNSERSRASQNETCHPPPHTQRR